MPARLVHILNNLRAFLECFHENTYSKATNIMNLINAMLSPPLATFSFHLFLNFSFRPTFMPK